MQIKTDRDRERDRYRRLSWLVPWSAGNYWLIRRRLKPCYSCWSTGRRQGSATSICHGIIFVCVPMKVPSSSVDRLHVCLPLFLFHCGFHLRACWAGLEGGFLRVWLSFTVLQAGLPHLPADRAQQSGQPADRHWRHQHQLPLSLRLRRRRSRRGAGVYAHQRQRRPRWRAQRRHRCHRRQLWRGRGRYRQRSAAAERIRGNHLYCWSQCDL